MSFACAAKLTSFRPKILQAAVAVSRLGLTTMLTFKNALDNISVIQRLLLNGGGFLLAVSRGTLQSN